eukprot:RCo019198
MLRLLRFGGMGVRAIPGALAFSRPTRSYSTEDTTPHEAGAVPPLQISVALPHLDDAAASPTKPSRTPPNRGVRPIRISEVGEVTSKESASAAPHGAEPGVKIAVAVPHLDDVVASTANSSRGETLDQGSSTEPTTDVVEAVSKESLGNAPGVAGAGLRVKIDVAVPHLENVTSSLADGSCSESVNQGSSARATEVCANNADSFPSKSSDVNLTAESEEAPAKQSSSGEPTAQEADASHQRNAEAPTKSEREKIPLKKRSSTKRKAAKEAASPSEDTSGKSSPTVTLKDAKEEASSTNCFTSRPVSEDGAIPQNESPGATPNTEGCESTAKDRPRAKSGRKKKNPTKESDESKREGKQTIHMLTGFALFRKYFNARPEMAGFTSTERMRSCGLAWRLLAHERREEWKLRAAEMFEAKLVEHIFLELGLNPEDSGAAGYHQFRMFALYEDKDVREMFSALARERHIARQWTSMDDSLRQKWLEHAGIRFKALPGDSDVPAGSGAPGDSQGGHSPGPEQPRLAGSVDDSISVCEDFGNLKDGGPVSLKKASGSLVNAF